MIRCVVAEDSTERAVSAMDSMAPDVEWVEVRLDLIRDDPDVEAIFSRSRGFSTIATARPTWEGGSFRGEEADRLALLERASFAGAEIVDVEHRAGRVPRVAGSSRILLSWHDFEATPSDLPGLYQEIAERRPAEVKIVTRCRRAADLVALKTLLRRVREAGPVSLTAFGMGEIGFPSRVLAEAWGSMSSYVAWSPDGRTAPGQVSWAEFQETYRPSRLGSSTRIFGVAGCPVRQSLGPLLHNRFFADEKIDAVYLPFYSEDFGELQAAAAGLGLCGLSVTIPHKARAAEVADFLNEEAEACGACNTLLWESEPGQGRIRGFSFDGEAAVSALADGVGGEARFLDLASRGPIALVGAGGTAAAIGSSLGQRGIPVSVYNRNPERAEELARRIRGLGFGGGLEDLGSSRPPVLVHATSVGMEPASGECCVPEDTLRECGCVLDAVYRPLQTELLKRARSRGAVTVNGLEMFVRQASMQACRFVGKSFSLEWARELLRERLEPRTSEEASK